MKRPTSESLGGSNADTRWIVPSSGTISRAAATAASAQSEPSVPTDDGGEGHGTSLSARRCRQGHTESLGHRVVDRAGRVDGGRGGPGVMAHARWSTISGPASEGSVPTRCRAMMRCRATSGATRHSISTNAAPCRPAMSAAARRWERSVNDASSTTDSPAASRPARSPDQLGVGGRLGLVGVQATAGSVAGPVLVSDSCEVPCAARHCRAPPSRCGSRSHGRVSTCPSRGRRRSPPPADAPAPGGAARGSWYSRAAPGAPATPWR